MYLFSARFCLLHLFFVSFSLLFFNFFFLFVNFSAPLPHCWRRVFVRLVLVQSVLKKLLEFLAPFSIHTTFPKNKTFVQIFYLSNLFRAICEKLYERNYTNKTKVYTPYRNCSNWNVSATYDEHFRSHTKCRRKLGKICKITRSRTGPSDIIFNKVLPAILANTQQQAKRKLVCRFAVIPEIVLLMQFFCNFF